MLKIPAEKREEGKENQRNKRRRHAWCKCVKLYGWGYSPLRAFFSSSL
jgi:hypothetical protein